MRLVYFLILISFGFISCSKEEPAPINNYKTENIVVIVMDGARYSETWDIPENIPIYYNYSQFQMTWWSR